MTLASHTTAAFVPQVLPGRALIRLTGDKVLTFLHTLVTADVATLPIAHTTYGALLSPQGKIQHDMFITNLGDSVLIDCVASQREDLIRKLIMYRLREKIDIAAENTLLVAVAPEAPPDGRMADPRHPQLGERRYLPIGAATGGRNDYNAFRLALGVADGETDIGVNTHFPHEANFDLLHGVSFRKGCYVGQEVVSRMQHRSTTRSRMLPVTLDGQSPGKGTAIMSDRLQLGTLLSSQDRRALALVRLDRLAAATAPPLAGDVGVHFHKPEWMTLDLIIPAVAR